MAPIEVPITRRRWSTLRPSVTSRYCAFNMSPSVYFGNFRCSPSLGLLDFPCPMPSGRMMKYLVASSSWPGPNSWPAKFCDRNTRPPAPVPWAVVFLRRDPAAVAAGAVGDQHRVGDDPPGVASRGADRGVVEAELGQGLAAREREVAGDEVGFDRRRVAGGGLGP